MRRFLMLAAVFGVTLGGCRDDPTSVRNAVVEVRRESGGLRITNLTDTPRAYTAWDQNTLILADADLGLIALCNTLDSGCLRLPARASVLMPFSDVGGYSSSTKAIVVWTWRVVPGPAGGQNEVLMDDTIVLKL